MDYPRKKAVSDVGKLVSEGIDVLSGKGGFKWEDVRQKLAPSGLQSVEDTVRFITDSVKKGWNWLRTPAQHSPNSAKKVQSNRQVDNW